MRDATVVVEDGRIVEVGQRGGGEMAHGYDATGLLVLPGFIDLHSDAIENEIQPRPGGRFPLEMALFELNKKLASCGITTMYHSLSFSMTDKNEIRQPDTAREIVRTIKDLDRHLDIRNRVHARYEMIDIGCASLLEELVEEGLVDLFSVMDHTPGQGQFVSMDAFKEYYGAVDHMNAEELEALAERRLRARRTLDMSHVVRLTRLCAEMGIPMASHDDDTLEKVRWVKSLGIALSEFPVTVEAASGAAEEGIHVLMGAPNILRGRSLTKNLSGRQAVQKGWCDIMGSDYSPASMLHALFALDRLGILPFNEIVNMVSLNPARAVGLDLETGAIREGLKADLVLVDTATRVPVIVGTIVEGRPVYFTGPR